MSSKQMIAQQHRADAEALGLYDASSGLSAWRTAKIASVVDGGRDYTGLSKGQIASNLLHRPGHVVNSILEALRKAVRS